MKTFEQTAREALAKATNEDLESLENAKWAANTIQTLAQGYLDLLAENEKFKQMELANGLSDNLLFLNQEAQVKITQLKRENEKLQGFVNGCCMPADVVAFREKNNLSNPIEKLQLDNAKLIEALKFYADNKNWSGAPATSHPDSPTIDFINEKLGGDIARAALTEVGDV